MQNLQSVLSTLTAKLDRLENQHPPVLTCCDLMPRTECYRAMGLSFDDVIVLAEKEYEAEYVELWRDMLLDVHWKKREVLRDGINAVKSQIAIENALNVI